MQPHPQFNGKSYSVKVFSGHKITINLEVQKHLLVAKVERMFFLACFKDFFQLGEWGGGGIFQPEPIKTSLVYFVY